MLKDKDRLLNKAKRTNKPDDWTKARDARNKFKTDVYQAKSEFIKDNLERFKADPKK